MATSNLQLFISLLRGGADLTGLCMLAALLAVSGWYCLQPQRRSQLASLAISPTAAPIRQPRRFYLLLCMLPAPLLMFAGLASGLALLQQAYPAALAQAGWKHYRALVWLLYGAIGLQQLFALQRMSLQLSPQRRRFVPLAATALVLLPAAMALSLLALDHVYFGGAGMPHASWAGAAAASITGIALWLLTQAPARAEYHRKTMHAAQEPRLTGIADQAPQELSPVAAPAALKPAGEVEPRVSEIPPLPAQEQQDKETPYAGQDQHQDQHQDETLEQNEVLMAASIREKVSEQRFLFESGLPCNLGVLVHGLVILDQALDLRDHVRGDTLLHAAVREDNGPLAQYLIENGTDVDAVNWAGLSARASTRNVELQKILDMSPRREK
jgi:hypothetical protein